MIGANADDPDRRLTRPASGKTRIQSYYYADHGEILQALQEYPGMDLGRDFSIELQAVTYKLF